MFGRRRSLGTSPPPGPNSNDISYHPLPLHASKASVNDGLTRSRSSASTWIRTAAPSDSSGLELLPRQGLRKSLSSRPLSRKSGLKLQQTPPSASPDGDGHCETILDDYYSSSSSSSIPRVDLRAHFSRAAAAPERVVVRSAFFSTCARVFFFFFL
jgi:hypothetical protein